MPKSKILNQVQDLVRHDKGVILNSFQNPILDFDIRLTFGPALAGLNFELFCLMR